MSIRTPHALRTAVAAAALVIVLALTGCQAPLAKGNQVSPAEAKQDTIRMLDDTIAFIGGDDWSPRLDNPFQPCTVKGHKGQYTYWIQQRAWDITPEARDQLAERLQTWLKEQGYTTWTGERNPNDPMVYVYAENGAVEGFSAYIAPNGISIQADSWCVTGTDTPTPTAG